jgi:hypothetical protein
MPLHLQWTMRIAEEFYEQVGRCYTTSSTWSNKWLHLNWYYYLKSLNFGSLESMSQQP